MTPAGRAATRRATGLARSDEGSAVRDRLFDLDANDRAAAGVFLSTR